MSKKISSKIFSTAALSQRARVLWMLFLVLSPLAYLAGAMLVRRTDPNMKVGLTVGRDDALRISADYAARELGLNVERWRTGCKIDPDNDRHLYFRLHASDANVERLRRLFPDAQVHTVFMSRSGAEKLEVMLAPDGKPNGFIHTPSPNQESADRGEPASRARAGEAMRALAARENLPLSGEPEMTEQRSFNNVSRRYTWTHRFESLPEMNFKTAITVAGDAVIGQELTTKIDSGYASRNLINHAVAPIVAIGLSYLLIFIFALYGLYRYIQRARQKEVAHGRSLLLCLAVAASYMFIALQTDFHKFSLQTNVNPTVMFWFMIATTLIVFIMLGLVIGLAYGSSEGDTREAFPGKLTSLDALLTGRIFSKNVARAVCVGCAVGGWILLARALVMLPWASSASAGSGLMDKTYGILLGHTPSLLPLMTAPLGAIVMAVPGLLLPLSFLHGRVRSNRVLLAILITLAFITSVNIFQDRPMTFTAGMLLAAVSAAALLVPFFAFDFLTVIVALAASSLASFAIYLAAQTVPTLYRAGYMSLAIAAGFFLVELFFLYKGREYTEAQVRPLYARHLAERLVLQAEVSAAREAQVRLLPQTIPDVAGLNIAAVCRPAHVVGGDFYDLFVLDDKRLGVFVAEGGSHGLEAAMIIAFAKGFLMPRLNDRHKPSEIICDLQARLTPMLEEGQALALVYAIVDRDGRTLDYACTGAYPEVVLRKHQADGGEPRGSLTYTREQEVAVPLGEGLDVSCTVREASVALGAGDAVIFYTDGVARSFGDDPRAAESWATGILNERARKASSLQATLARSLEKQARRIKRASMEDDLTAVVVRLEADGNA
ncbi:MAG TPA: SpoIIE family protein phosphatase [Pyrinomonadaceae bacterium]|jgi:serine phosphatase RsbU (regulator of sigma subunit)|nr:SpoIIE family protein phosphatase [Pyrinomonadaceae bacterium]